SFPTRRSSDLDRQRHPRRRAGARGSVQERVLAGHPEGLARRELGSGRDRLPDRGPTARGAGRTNGAPRAGPDASDRLAPWRLSAPASTDYKRSKMTDKHIDEAKGRVKEAAGSLTGDKDLKNEGTVDQAKSSVKDTVDKVADKVTPDDDGPVAPWGIWCA